MVDLKEMLVKNKEKFIETYEKYDLYTKELIDFMGEEIYTSPASPMKHMYGAYPGGLTNHILLVTKYAIKINSLLPTEQRVESSSSIIKVCFLHQIGKIRLFKFCESEWHRNNQGKIYEYNEDLVSMRIGERSAYYALTNNIKMTEEEYQAIINFDKPEEDKMAKFHGSTLSTILKQANELAIIEQKSDTNE